MLKWLIKHTVKKTGDTSGDPPVQYAILFHLNKKRVSQFLIFQPTHTFKYKTHCRLITWLKRIIVYFQCGYAMHMLMKYFDIYTFHFYIYIKRKFF